MNELITLYKPLTPAQLAVVIESRWRELPPDHPDQKYFYPKLAKTYAEFIARAWSAPKFSAGYVAKFTIEEQFINQYTIETIANEIHKEYKIPIDDLPSLNKHIIGPINIVSAFHLDISKEFDSVSLKSCYSFH